jgi:iron(III) transport system substrate-binding protein
MARFKARIFPFLYVVLAVLFCLFFLPSCKKNSATNQPEVVLYCSVDQEIAEPVIAEFQKQSGIKVLARYDTEASKTVGLVQKIRVESASPVADVFWSSEVFHTIRLARESLLRPYNSNEAKNRPAFLQDKDGRWYGFALRARVIAYNTKKVSAGDAPKKLEDCLDSKWKGRIVMASPAFGTTGGDVASWFAHYGQDKAQKILNALKANDIRFVEGNSTAVRMVASGQADICFTDTDDVYAGQRNSWPVALNFLDQAGDGVLVIPNTAAIIAGCPHPKQAEVFMDFLLGEKTELMLVQSDSHNSPIHQNLADKYKSYSIVNPLNIDYNKVADVLNTSIEAAQEMFP